MNVDWLHLRRTNGRDGWLIFFMTLCVGCSNVNREQSTTIVVSGDTAGWITPCGCASNQSGGLLRRATLIGSFDEPNHILYLDAGGSASRTSEYQQVKLEAILRGLKAMGIAAHNIGAPEAAFGAKKLAKLAKATGIVWLSSNLEPAQGDSPAKRCIVVERDGFRIAVAGVVDPALMKNTEWSAHEPVSAVLAAFRNVQADVHILLAYCDEAGLRSLAQSLPELDFIIGGPTGQAMKPTTIGPTCVLSATNKGKFIARIQLVRAGAKPYRTAQIGPVEVSSDLVEDAAQVDNLARYHEDLAKRDFTADEAGLVSNRQRGVDEYQIAGSDACAKCHAADQAEWHSSKHSQAFEVLVAKCSQFDPFCQQCHTTGYGDEGGFVSVGRSSQLVSVGCENCHGPSSAHVANPKARTPFLAREKCIHCHDHENSPQFAFETYWSKIRHGQR
jgi:hypothetical protein